MPKAQRWPKVGRPAQGGTGRAPTGGKGEQQHHLQWREGLRLVVDFFTFSTGQLFSLRGPQEGSRVRNSGFSARPVRSDTGRGSPRCHPAKVFHTNVEV